MKESGPPKLARFPAMKQRRLDRLLEKNSEGIIAAKEKVALEALVAEAEEYMVANARLLAQFSKSETTHPPADAVPVMVWVRPYQAER